jgi:hypothetical protein
LHKVASNQKVLLVWGNLDVVRSNDGLNLVRVIQTLRGIEVGDVESSDVVSVGDGKVSPLAIIADIRVDGNGILCLVAEAVEELCNTWLAIGILALWVDDPDFSRDDSTERVSKWLE